MTNTSLYRSLFSQGILLDIYTIFNLRSLTGFGSRGSHAEELNPHTCINNINFLPSLKGFRVGHINLASLTKHIDELKIYLEKEPLDILSINESRLDETIITDFVNVPGYELITKNRNRTRGGVAIYHRSVLNVVNRKESIPVNVEDVCLEVIRPKCKVTKGLPNNSRFPGLSVVFWVLVFNL